MVEVNKEKNMEEVEEIDLDRLEAYQNARNEIVRFGIKYLEKMEFDEYSSREEYHEFRWREELIDEMLSRFSENAEEEGFDWYDLHYNLPIDRFEKFQANRYKLNDLSIDCQSVARSTYWYTKNEDGFFTKLLVRTMLN
tara:strand:- start:3212 stop:3628 length:417 start_codon:yes stop_codon:yes gene_type:complete